jgi:Uma2 family endonuclease
MSAATALPPRKRFTRSEVLQMADSGLFLDQKLELIDGDLIDKMGQKPPHAYAVRTLQALLAALFGADRIQVQLPMEVSGPDQKWSLPEPDLAVLKQAKSDFQARYPRGTELLLVIEIADTSAQHDLTIKRDLYLRAQVSEYWALDLKRRCLVVHRHPNSAQYASVLTLNESESASLEGSNLKIAIARMLPESHEN